METSRTLFIPVILGTARMGRMITTIRCLCFVKITTEAMDAALSFCEWQEQIRAQYQPGLSEDLDGKCAEAILVTLMTLPKCKSCNWSSLAKLKNWYKKYGVSRLTRVRSGLVKAGEIEFDEESGVVWV